VTKDHLIFTTCGFLLGLVIGSLVIGPKIAEWKQQPAATASAAPSIVAQAPATQGNPMAAVQQQIAALKTTIDREPNNADALVQLGNLYMDAAKFPQAIDYYERAVAVRDSPTVRTDLGICYKETGQLDRALEQFRRATSSSPPQWQALYNEAIVLGEMHRVPEAREVAAKLTQLRPDDPEVKQLNEALAKAQ
jgi:tetratricopeptide (TPR) repeat protein